MRCTIVANDRPQLFRFRLGGWLLARLLLLPGSGFSDRTGLFWVDSSVRRAARRWSRVASHPPGVAPPSARADEALSKGEAVKISRMKCFVQAPL
jgi:hypothetical protein